MPCVWQGIGAYIFWHVGKKAVCWSVRNKKYVVNFYYYCWKFLVQCDIYNIYILDAACRVEYRKNPLVPFLYIFHFILLAWVFWNFSGLAVPVLLLRFTLISPIKYIKMSVLLDRSEDQGLNLTNWSLIPTVWHIKRVKALSHKSYNS